MSIPILAKENLIRYNNCTISKKGNKNMKLQMSKPMKQILISGFGLAVLIGVGVSLLIHKLGEIVRGVGDAMGLGEDTETFAVIFDQLQEATVDLPSWLLLFACVILAWGLIRYFGSLRKVKEKSKWIYGIGFLGWVFCGLLGVTVVTVLTLWFTNVNEVQFGTVVQFLYDALQHGVF